MNNIYMESDEQIRAHIKHLDELLKSFRWQLDFFDTQEQTPYVVAQVEAAHRLTERYQHEQKVCAAELYRREQENMAELMDDYMDSQRNL